MAPTKNSTSSTLTNVLDVDIDVAGEYVHDLNDRMLATAKQAGTLSLDACEKTLTSMLDFGQDIARTWQPDWANLLTAAHTDFVRSLGTAYIAVARESLT